MPGAGDGKRKGKIGFRGGRWVWKEIKVNMQPKVNHIVTKKSQMQLKIVKY